MEKTLNDTIDGIFRGVVFIVLDTITSLGRLIFLPRKGALKLLQRLYSHDVEQVRPYVFLFLSLVAFPFVILGAQTFAPHKPSLRFSFYRDGQDLFAPSAVRELFDNFSATLDGKVFLPILFGSIFGVTLLHIVLRVLARVSFFNKNRRQSAINLFLYLAGAQVALLALGALVQELWAHHHSARLSVWPLEIWGYLVSLNEQYAAMDRRIILAVGGLAIWALLLPWPVALLLARRTRFCTRTRSAWRAALVAVSLTLAADLGLFVTCYITGYIQEQGAQPKAMAYKVGEVSCTLAMSPTPRLTALVLVNNTGSAPHLFANDSFSLSLSARSVENPGSPESSDRQREKRATIDVGMSESVTESGPSSPVFLEPGKWALLHVESETLVAPVLKWAREHTDEVRCLVRDSDDAPAGGVGYADISAAWKATAR